MTVFLYIPHIYTFAMKENLLFYRIYRLFFRGKLYELYEVLTDKVGVFSL